jgi:hypothetical protein
LSSRVTTAASKSRARWVWEHPLASISPGLRVPSHAEITASSYGVQELAPVSTPASRLTP